MYYCRYKSPVGTLMLASEGDSLIGLWMLGQKHFARSLSPNAVEDTSVSALKQATAWLDRYFAGERPSPRELHLAPEGSPFRQAVWKLLTEIPYGETVTYGELARKLVETEGAVRTSPRAVGGAVGHNPISIIIPCHRVIGADGSLTGYAGGLEKKRWLLEFEGVDVEKHAVHAVLTWK